MAPAEEVMEGVMTWIGALPTAVFVLRFRRESYEARVPVTVGVLISKHQIQISSITRLRDGTNFPPRLYSCPLPTKGEYVRVHTVSPRLAA